MSFPITCDCEEQPCALVAAPAVGACAPSVPPLRRISFWKAVLGTALLAQRPVTYDICAVLLSYTLQNIKKIFIYS